LRAIRPLDRPHAEVCQTAALPRSSWIRQTREHARIEASERLDKRPPRGLLCLRRSTP
jgi:hypothetical protein